MENLKVMGIYVPLFQTLLWIALILIAVKIFFPELRSVLESIQGRIKRGSAFKLGPVELGEDLQYLQRIEEQTDAEPLSTLEGELDYAGVSSEAAPAVESGEESQSRQLNAERNSIYGKNRNLFLTHVIRPSEERGQKYDVFIYLIRHGGQSFEDVEVAEFFLGPYWGNRIFKRYEQNRRIGLTTAAYGTFLCTCWVEMKDGKRVFLSRYIDFEMGRVFKERA